MNILSVLFTRNGANTRIACNDPQVRRLQREAGQVEGSKPDAMLQLRAAAALYKKWDSFRGTQTADEFLKEEIARMNAWEARHPAASR